MQIVLSSVSRLEKNFASEAHQSIGTSGFDRASNQKAKEQKIERGGANSRRRPTNAGNSAMSLRVLYRYSFFVASRETS